MKEVKLCPENFFEKTMIQRLIREEEVDVMDMDELQIDVHSGPVKTGTKRKYEEDEAIEKELVVERPTKRAWKEEEAERFLDRAEHETARTAWDSKKRRIEDEDTQQEVMAERPKKWVRLAKLQIDEGKQNGKEYRKRERERHAEVCKQQAEERKRQAGNRDRGRHIEQKPGSLKQVAALVSH